MISKLLYTLTAGLKHLQSNTHLLLVAILLIVLPGIFMWVAQSIFSVSYQNIETVQKQTVAQLHDALELVLTTNVSPVELQELVGELVAASDEMVALRVITDDGAGLNVTQSSAQNEVGIAVGAERLFMAPRTPVGETSILATTINDARNWQAVRQVEVDENLVYIYSEHSFQTIDALLVARQQQVYLALPLIFLFLLLLAYWLVKQTHWQKQYLQTKEKLAGQMDFTNTAVHELRAPLTAIRGYISFLTESTTLSTDERKYVEIINMSSKRLLLLVNDFLEVARIQSGSLKIKFREANISKILIAVQTEFQQMADKKNIELIVKAPKKPVIEHTDEARLQQVLTNIVSNAIKYTETGSVTISLQQSRHKTVIAIKDTGHGISAEDQQKLFGAFTRVGNADESGVTGTGLGMWITKELVELLNGKVTVESIEGIGTHVKLSFDV
jgi:signal transduction histidine kinase